MKISKKANGALVDSNGVVKINTSQIGDGKPGKFVTALREEYIKQALESSI